MADEFADNEYEEGDNLVEWINAQKNAYLMSLKSKHLNDDQVKIIAKELKVNNDWKCVVLADNQISGAIRVQYLADALMVNKELDTLTLSKNYLLDEGLKLICDSLKMNSKTQLRLLDLDENKITDEGCKYISEMLIQNTKLCGLNLDDNLIGDGGLLSLAHAVIINSNNNSSTNGLLQISIRNNKISDNSVDVIIDLFKNSRLETLSLGGNQISNEGTNRLRQVFADSYGTSSGDDLYLSRIPPRIQHAQGRKT
ncbi:unnamed protein product [Didymodactylos carnosus]|uniref:Uncharacterized protein n=1 Tax=Didymodactylos carnosus TaxID=1234261 RepID=A0A813VDC2_9BILA|nr:unnamed protein product [Didymodactylos carnosus]CAF1010502.1 unnamed protein product [Didymodactylos carnosus]CAF3623913.1 unnamed protein product [Didymodactylos carnosus]CAF3779318.1 unnamed protein product [Didymodactylos carnosus]